MGLALHNYHDTFKKFGFGHHFQGIHGGTAAQGGMGYGWQTGILPYIEQGNLYNRFDQRLVIMYRAPGGTAAHDADLNDNGSLATTPLATFSCPSDTKPPQRNDGAIPNSATSSYQGASSAYDGWGGKNVLRRNGVFSRNNRLVNFGLRDMTDGTSNQFVVCETKWDMDRNRRNRSRIYGSSDNVAYARGATNALMVHGERAMNWTQPEGNNQPHRTAGSNHVGGAQFAFGDGSVHFISENIHHTSSVWNGNANAYMDVPSGLPYGTYQRYFSVSDGLVIENSSL